MPTNEQAPGAANAGGPENLTTSQDYTPLGTSDQAPGPAPSRASWRRWLPIDAEAGMPRLLARWAEQPQGGAA